MIMASCIQPAVETVKETIKEKKQQRMDASLPDLPEKMIYCGQTIDLTDEDVRERLDREVLVNVYFNSSTTQIIKRANRFFPLIEKILAEENMPDDLKYIAAIESSLLQAVSPAGAEGMWQFMPVTAKQYGLKLTPEIDERLDVVKSTRAACAYLRDAQDTLKDWVLASASYNRGIGGVRSDMRWQGTDNYFDTYMNAETARYVYRILAMKLIMEDPEAYGYVIPERQLYKVIPTQKIRVTESISNLAEWAKEKGSNFKMLKKLNPWLLGNKLTVKKGSVVIELPK
jgi:membrane-bound lytic murein transglycosylase D